MEKQQAYHLTENLIRSTTPISQRSTTPLINNNKNEKTLSTSSSHSYLKGPSSSSSSSPITLPPLSHISPLPTNAIIFHNSKSPQDDDHTFHKYMDQQFQKDASVLLKNQQSQKDNTNNNNNSNDNDNDNISIHEPSTLWSALQTDLNEIKKNHEKIFYKEGDHHHDHDHEEEHIVRPWWTFDQHDGFFSIGAILFLFGFIFPPLWWLGSFWPKQSHRGGKMARRWQQLNRYFSIGFSIIVVILIIVFAALYSTHQYT